MNKADWNSWRTTIALQIYTVDFRTQWIAVLWAVQLSLIKLFSECNRKILDLCSENRGCGNTLNMGE